MLDGVTLGGQSAYRSAYVTTLGATIYLPTGFWDRDDDSCYIVLRHDQRVRMATGDGQAEATPKSA